MEMQLFVTIVEQPAVGRVWLHTNIVTLDVADHHTLMNIVDLDMADHPSLVSIVD